MPKKLIRVEQNKETELNTETRNSAQKKTFVVDDTAKAAAELSHILLNLRYWSKTWHENFGHSNRERKEHWEKKADKWIEEHTKKETIDNDKNQ